MKKINQHQANDEVRYFRIIATGECLYGLAYHWDAKVDLANKTYVSRFEESEHASSTFPSINELVANGTLEVVNELEELDITGEDVDLQDFDAVVAIVEKNAIFSPLADIIHSDSGCQNWMTGWIGRRPIKSETHSQQQCGGNPAVFFI